MRIKDAEKAKKLYDEYSSLKKDLRKACFGMYLFKESQEGDKYVSVDLDNLDSYDIFRLIKVDLIRKLEIVKRKIWNL